MKALFTAIRRGDRDDVRSRLDRNPDLVHSTAKAPPRKDDGQSPLQVAIKTGQFPIAHLLLDRGADIDFQETSEVNRWTTPVLHDAVMAAVMSSRWGRTWPAGPGDAGPRFVPSSTAERFAAAHGVLERMVTAGADVHASDSFGNAALDRAVLDARQIVDVPLTLDLSADLHRVFDLLLGAGADPGRRHPEHGTTLAQMFAGDPVLVFLRAEG